MMLLLARRSASLPANPPSYETEQPSCTISGSRLGAIIFGNLHARLFDILHTTLVLAPDCIVASGSFLGRLRPAVKPHTTRNQNPIIGEPSPANIPPLTLAE